MTFLMYLQEKYINYLLFTPFSSDKLNELLSLITCMYNTYAVFWNRYCIASLDSFGRSSGLMFESP